MYFNPRSPCGERRRYLERGLMSAPFQSTLSLRRATLILYPDNFYLGNFNPRSPCGERRWMM